MRRFFAVLCLLLFTCQAIPVKGIVRLLSKGQTTEDVQDDNNCCDDDASGLTALYGSDIILPATFFDLGATCVYFENKSPIIIRNTWALPSVYVSNVPAPPPDFS